MENEVKRLSLRLIQTRSDNQSLNKMLEGFKRYIYLEKLDRESVVELIDKVIVSKKYLQDGIKQQDIDIHYNFIGKVKKEEQTA